MLGKVTVTADESGNVIYVAPNNPDYGSVRIEQTTMAINDNGWVRASKRSTFLKGLVKDLQMANYQKGQELPGKIIVRESTVPFNTLYADKDLKIAGATGVVCRIDDEPIYRQTFYTQNENAHDEVLMHTNADEIRAAQALLRVSADSLIADEVSL